MKTPKISIIVPVYNVEKWLRRCIDSILAQTYTDFELLLIDDGSLDSSGKICDEYAAKDERIAVFHKENGGVSTARNLGIEKARGEWIYFCDSDDEMMSEGLQILVEGIRDSCNLIVAGYERIDEDSIFSTLGKIPNGILSYEEMLLLMFAGTHPYQGYLFNKLFSHSGVDKKGIRFDETLTFNEDRTFTVEFLCKIKGKVNMIDVPIYRYFALNGGAMASLQKGFNRKFITDLYAFDKMLNLLKSTGNEKILPVAKVSIFTSYASILGMMKKWKVADDDLKGQLSNILHSHVSRYEELYYWIRYIICPCCRHKIKSYMIICKNMIFRLPPPVNNIYIIYDRSNAIKSGFRVGTVNVRGQLMFNHIKLNAA